MNLRVFPDLHAHDLPDTIEHELQLLFHSAESTLDRLRISLPDSFINVIITSDIVVRKLNRQFRNKDSFTDVLTFVSEDPDTFAEIFISLDRARVQAQEHGHDTFSELVLLFLHGLLHAAGFDHERSSSDLRIFRNLEVELAHAVMEKGTPLTLRDSWN